MPKSILTIGFALAAGAAHREAFDSGVSLSDWDIILFKPQIDEFISPSAELYHGKPRLEDHLSTKLKESSEHWRREIRQATEAGKTVLVFLSTVQEVYINSRERNFSRSGNNQMTITKVGAYHNYMALPLPLILTNTTGKAMKLAALGDELLSPFWTEFGAVSECKVCLQPDIEGVCLTTAEGGEPVGAIFQNRESSGALVLLPDINFYPDKFFEEEGDEQVWSFEAEQFAVRMASAVVALDQALHASAEITPEPAWATGPSYLLAVERGLRSELLDAEYQITAAQRRKEDVLERLKIAGCLRALLFEKRKPLEAAIIEGLRLLGFHTVPQRNPASSFEVAFECAEGRILAEAEGKDSKAISIDNLRQLVLNIHEDLQREEINAPAKGVLFGNGYRLIPPKDRETQFTKKCINAAESSSIALLATSDLYRAAQYLSDQANAGYAARCRKAILTGVGLVALPPPPRIGVVEPAEHSK